MRKINTLYSVITLSFTVALMPASYASNPINSTQDGRVIQGGTYYNTVGNRTAFINSQAGGLWLKAGTTLRGLEANSSGKPNNNGGTIHLYAPDNVVRVDGNIDVNALRSNTGSYLGNGGNVFVDSAYLFQNGNIFANGANGGLVQINVAGMTLGVGSQIQAKGATGVGGTVAINSSGPVILRRASLVDSSGKVSGSFDANLINIEGSLISNEGTLRADGVNSRGGSIRLVAGGQSSYQDIKDSLQAATINPSEDTSTPTITQQERIFLLQRIKGLIDNHEGQVFLSKSTSSSTSAFISQLSANGGGGIQDPNNDYTQSTSPRAGDGGNITLLAMQGIQNLGTIKANGSSGRSGTTPVNGGNGGTISLVSQSSISNNRGRLESNGGNGGASSSLTAGDNGGDGGLIAFGYNGPMSNTGGIYADGAMGGNGTQPGHGGNGGLMVFSGNNNPTGKGSLDVIGRSGGNNNSNLGGKSGTIVSPNPGTLGQTQIYFQQGYVDGQRVRSRATQQTQPVELLTHAENLIMLTKNGGSITPSDNVFLRMNQAQIRSVDDPVNSLGLARSEVILKNTPTSAYVYRNLILGSSRDGLMLDLTPPNENTNPSENIFSSIILPSPLSLGLGLSTRHTLSIVNDGSLFSGGPSSVFPDEFQSHFGVWSLTGGKAGARISILANGDVSSNDVLATSGANSGGSIHIASLGTINNGNGNNGLLSTKGETHGGSMLLKAQSSINNGAYIYFPSHIEGSGGLLGGTIRLYAKEGMNEGYDGALNNGQTVLIANGNAQGGIIWGNFGGSFNNKGLLQANGQEGNGGYINIHTDNALYNSPAIDSPTPMITADGGLNGGTIVLTAGDHIKGNEGRPTNVSFPPAFFGPPENYPTFNILRLTPPVTKVNTTTNWDHSESVYNFGIINAIGSNGRNGKIYLGANEQVTFGQLNNVSTNYSEILASPNRNQAFQTTFLPTQANGGQVYIVAGQTLTNKAGQTRNAVDATKEAVYTKSAPNVNPNQNGQGALLPNDFFLPNP